MELEDKHVVVTGAGSGIGRALARAFAAEGARAVVVADLDADAARTVAEEIGGLAVAFDAGREDGIRGLIDTATDAHGPIDLFFSNAGVPGAMGGPAEPDEAWDLAWRVNVMSHVWAARALVPGMVERGEGYIASTASAAGLLTQVSSLTYSATKHAAVSVAEWLAIEYGDAGIRVSCLCPQGVRTPMLDLAMAADDRAGAAALAAGGFLDPEEVAEVTVAGIRDERFLILPHTDVAGFLALKGSNPERWLKGMRRMVREARQTPADSGSR